MKLGHVLLRAGCAVAGVLFALGASAADFSYAEAAKPYKGKSIRVLDEVTPLQEALSKIVPDFEKETGIKVDWELLNHAEVINKGQADMLSGRGYYDAVMLHGFQLGPLLTANVVRPVDDLIANKALANPGLDAGDFIQRPYKTLAFHKGKQYGFLNWNYNQVYWARADLLEHPGEQAAFKASTATTSLRQRRSSRCATSPSSSRARRARSSPTPFSTAISTA